ncbi:MAG: RAMP superfamily CRISPR-associated protein [Planctomycetota bacterium]
MVSIRTIEANLRVETPLFCEGARGTEPTLRAPSLKGALCFWWRALRSFDSHEAMRAQEQALFGGSSPRTGQSKLLLSVADAGSGRPGDQSAFGDLPGTRYMLGQGLGERDHVRAGGLYDLQLTLRVQASAAQEAEVIQALKALCLLGAVGSRSRRGLGSLSLVSLAVPGQEPWHPPATLEELAQEIRALLPDDARDALPEYSAFSKETRIVLLSSKGDAASLLEQLGLLFQSFRSHEREEPTGPSIGREDHDLMYRFAGGGEVERPPRRAVFGLPHNYYLRKAETKNIQVQPAQENRRASPLLFHVQGLGPAGSCAVLTFLPARFLKEGEGILLKGGRLKRTVAVPENEELYRPVTQFLEFARAKFPNNIEVRP